MTLQKSRLAAISLVAFIAAAAPVLPGCDAGREGGCRWSIQLPPYQVVVYDVACARV